MIEIPTSVLHNPDEALAHEWLVTNGIGGYASSSVIGANTRRYHGLLVASFPPPLERQVVLSKVDEELIIGRGSHFLGANEYQGDVIHPDGHRQLECFRLDFGIPTFEYQIANVKLTKQVWMERGKDTVYVLYRLADSPCDAKLVIRPFCAFRGYHQDGWENGREECTAVQRDGHVAVESGRVPYSLRMYFAGGAFHPAEDRHASFLYRAERERGFQCSEDLYTPGIFVADLSPGQSVALVATCEWAAPDLDFEAALTREKSRRHAIVGNERSQFRRDLLLAADQFVVRQRAADTQPGSEKTSILAGYHWFTDWGRDSMISLPGLLLCTGRFEEARDILNRYIEWADGGMIPNRFTDSGAVEYNTADATLWYFHALYSYVKASGDDELLGLLFLDLANIVDWHFRGTRYGIHVDPKDGLLFAGDERSQVTWMDACVNGCPATPRAGKPVEINALWYNALNLMASWAGYAHHPGDFYMRAAENCRISFRRRFWNEKTRCLYDVVDGPAGDDAAIRPNQILAVSLPYSPLDSHQQRAVVEVVERELLTPYGLRTVSPNDPSYASEYRGGPYERDSVYHQGTVWPWLLGQFADAHYRVHRGRDQVAGFMRPFRQHLMHAGLGSISEIFDGDAPHNPRGCVAQAWSVAEILRICSSLPDLA